MGKIKRISVKTFKDILSGNINNPRDCIIKIYSPTCGLCHALAPLYKQAATEYEDKTFLTFNLTNTSQYMVEDSVSSRLRISHMEIATDDSLSSEERIQLSDSISYIEDVFYKLNELIPWHIERYTIPVRYGFAPYFLKIKTGYAPYVSHIRMLVDPEYSATDQVVVGDTHRLFDMRHLRDFIENDSKKVLTIK